VAVTFSSALSSASYRVVVTADAATGGFSPDDKCYFFNVSSKTTTGFSIDHRKCKDGNLVNVTPGVTVDWIVFPNK